MKPPTVAELRKEGWRVGVHHEFYGLKQVRDYAGGLTHSIEETLRLSASDIRLSPQGRPIGPGWRTDVSLTPPGEEQPIFASACCHIRDNFNRRLGLYIAVGRALKIHKQLEKANA